MATADPSRPHIALTAGLEQRLKQEDQLLQTTYEQNERLAQEIKTLQDQIPHVRLPDPQPVTPPSAAPSESKPQTNAPSQSPKVTPASNPGQRTWREWLLSWKHNPNK